MPEKEKLKESEVELKVAEEAPEAVPAVEPIPTEPALPMLDMHSLLHSMKTASCCTKWGAMVGDDRVRQCKVCKTNAYRIQGLDPRAVIELISSREPNPLTLGTKLYRRTDGAVMVHPGVCGKRLIRSRLMGLAFLAASGIASSVVAPGAPAVASLFVVCACACLAYASYVHSKRAARKSRTLTSMGAMLVISMAAPFAGISWQSHTPWSLAPNLVIAIAILVMLFSMFLDCLDLVICRIRGQNPDEPIPPKVPIELTPETVARRKRNRQIMFGALAATTAVVAYAAMDASWFVRFLQASMVSHGETYDEAEMQKLVDSSSGDRADVARTALAARQRQKKHTTQAKENFTKVIEDLAGKNTNNQILIAARTGLAETLLLEKNYSGAEAEANKALEELKSPDAAKGGLPIALGWHTTTRTDFVNDSLREIYPTLAGALEGNHKLADADALYTKLLHPLPGEQYNDYTSFKALKDYVDYLKRHHRTADATKAVENYGRETEQNAKDGWKEFAMAYVAKAYQYINDPRAEEALMRRVAYADQSGYSQVNPRLELAVCLSKAGKADKADRVFQQALKLATGYDRLRSVGLYCDFLLAQNRASEAAPLMQEFDKTVTLDALTDRELYKYIERYKKVMSAMHDGGATKYDTKLNELLKQHPDAAEPAYADELL